MENPQPTESGNAERGWRRLWRQPALRVGALALVVVIAQWADTRLQVSGLQQELARRLAEGDATAREGRTLARQGQESMAALQAKVAVLETRLAETQSQAVALEAMYQELSASRDERLLAEVEQAVVIAMQQLQFAGNVEAALSALQGAEARLARTVQPQFLPVRKLLARDIERLKGTPGANVSGLSLKIESVVSAVDGLPLAYEQRPKADAAKAPAKPASAGDWWRELGADFWRELRQLVRIERIDHGDPALLSPNQSFFLRETLKLRLLNARLALLARDQWTFRNELRHAQAWLERYFDPHSAALPTAQAAIRQLASTEISIELPTLGESLAAIKTFRLGKERR